MNTGEKPEGGEEGTHVGVCRQREEPVQGPEAGIQGLGVRNQISPCGWRGVSSDQKWGEES